LSEEDRTRLVANIVSAMKSVELEEIKIRQISHFYKADPEYGTRVAEGVGLVVTQEA
jgi:catalase